MKLSREPGDGRRCKGGAGASAEAASKLLSAGLLWALIVAQLIFCRPAASEELIEEYRTEITVERSSELLVRERILVRAEGVKIKRGIYRDFPTRYRDRYGNKVQVGFSLLQVLRDGSREAHHLVPHANGVRIYIGEQGRLLSPGRHSYEIVYRTSRQLGFFENHDELYFNAIGHGWQFPIRRAEALIFLPAELPDGNIRSEAYTGLDGARGADYAAHQPDARTVRFLATRQLNSYEGLTIVVMWPKGLVIAPDFQARLRYFASDNRDTLIVSGATIILLIYFWSAWLRCGRDPQAGVIFPQYAAPSNFSPADCRFVSQMKFDNRTFAASVINLAVKGFLEIEQAGAREFLLKRTPSSAQLTTLAPEERIIYEYFVGTRDQFKISSSNSAVVAEALKDCEKALKKRHQGALFHLNYHLLLPGLGIVLCGWMAAAFSQGFHLPFMLSVVNALLLLSQICGFLIFARLIRRPTPLGRQYLDQIEGLRMYLKTAEEDRLNALSREGGVPQLFETFLPFALALGVEQEWSERFARLFSQAEGNQYQPRWYHGDIFHPANVAAFSTALGSSLASSIASSASPPGSSSGGGGGGSSGGGGGGGGGGGW